MKESVRMWVNPIRDNPTREAIDALIGYLADRLNSVSLTSAGLVIKAASNVLVKAGHSCPELRAWGVLDSVLRMMPNPQEIFHQPEQFVSYFVSPKPPLENIRRDEKGISFDWPLPAEQYPLVATYLKAAFESLPVFVGQDMAQCGWDGIHLQLQWSQSQNVLFGEADPGHQISPHLFKQLIDDLQRTEREREELQKRIGDLEIQLKDFRMSRAKENEALANGDARGEKDLGDRTLMDKKKAKENSSGTLSLTSNTETPTVSLSSMNLDDSLPGHQIGQNLARLHDYMVRAQQLITMLAAQNKLSPGVKEAMRRMDWDFVKDQYPKTISDSVEALRKIQASFQLQSDAPAHKQLRDSELAQTQSHLLELNH
jgi:hypothetical protein